MAATYNPENINDGNDDYISVVRFLLADTDTDNAELSDEEITALYSDTAESSTQEVRNYQTAYRAAQYLYIKYSKQVTFSSAGTSVSLSDRHKHWVTVMADIGDRLLRLSNRNAITYAKRRSNFLDY